jgi:hypothetical protein
MSRTITVRHDAPSGFRRPNLENALYIQLPAGWCVDAQVPLPAVRLSKLPGGRTFLGPHRTIRSWELGRFLIGSVKPTVSILSTQNQPPGQDHSLVFRCLSIVHGYLIRGWTDILIDLATFDLTSTRHVLIVDLSTRTTSPLIRILMECKP